MEFKNYPLGEEVEVFSSTAGEFEIGLKSRCEDMPTGNYQSEADARQALRMLKIGCNGCASMPVTHMLDMEFVRNNAFASTRSLSGECTFEYVGPFADILMKIHVLDAHTHDRLDWNHYKDCGFLHGLVRSDGKISYTLRQRGEYFLGITIHRNLSESMKQNLQAMPPEKRKKRQDCIKHRLQGHWQERDEVEAETIAEHADYLISYASADKHENNRLLWKLRGSAIKGPHGDSPIQFCTDTSLGIGVHYYNEGELLHLGKHGFGMPPVGNWWEEYAQAAKQTKHGLLVLNPSSEYFTSDACKREFTQIRFANRDESRDINVYFPSRDGAEARIISRKDWTTFESECQRYDPEIMKAARADFLPDLVSICCEDLDAVHVTNFRNESSLHVAAGQGHERIVRKLIEFRAQVHCQGWSALHAAAKGGHAEIAAELLERRAEIDCRSVTQFTPLHYAANNGHADVAELLWNKQADLESKTGPEYRTTPLYLAVVTHSSERDHTMVIRFLLRARADVHARCNNSKHRNSQSSVELARDKQEQLGKELVGLLTCL